MDYSELTTTELTAMANALDQLMAVLDDPTLPDDFTGYLGEWLGLDEGARYDELGELSRLSTLHAYADGMDDPIDLITPILTDEQAIGHADLYPEWVSATAYRVAERVQYSGGLWKCLQAHTSQADWTPDATPALWTRVQSGGGIPEWVQPTGAHDAYAKGDKVTHSGKAWESLVDANVWEPGVYGWQED